ncbi:MxaD family protein [Bordetella genomosp. 8]|uniref:MxaD family protein n=1 Tax=Bordetella genomosp. 8 TaxID=1416806 RepID=A0A1W6YKI4_9BORD|nr:SRPBCC family protein [Bordetella genomosp. 8]ARP81538.1 MxaD family protein [Bordetella genomosp. 8]
MTTVFVSSVIDAPAGEVWATVRDFDAMPQWHPVIADSTIENGLTADRVGCVRRFHTRDGGLIREQLLALSDYDYTFTYAILESPMGVSDYVATLKLTPVTDGDRCFGEWSAEFMAPAEREAELKRFVGQEVFLAGFHALQARLSTRR